jgi:ABC-type glycerol-3-phosphate transport system permease component
MNRDTGGRIRAIASRALVMVVLGGAAIAIAAPFVWIFRGALSPTDGELYRLPPTLFPDEPTTANFGKVFDKVPFGRFVLNSLIVSTSITVAQIVTCSTAAFAFARLRFRGRDVAFGVVVASLMIPIQVTIVRFSW